MEFLVGILFEFLFEGLLWLVFEILAGVLGSVRTAVPDTPRGLTYAAIAVLIGLYIWFFGAAKLIVWIRAAALLLIFIVTDQIIAPRLKAWWNGGAAAKPEK